MYVEKFGADHEKTKDVEAIFKEVQNSTLR